MSDTTPKKSTAERIAWAVVHLVSAIGAAVVVALAGGAALGKCEGLGDGPVTLEEMRGSGDETWDKPGVIEKTRKAIEEVERQQDGTRAIEGAE